jgi:hypothetical protein
MLNLKAVYVEQARLAEVQLYGKLIKNPAQEAQILICAMVGDQITEVAA